jgi:hypothetical protein
MRTRLKVGGAIALVVALAITAAASGASSRRASGRSPNHGCDLGNGGHSRIKHVIYLQFDNTHLLRDRSNFASDLELMPHLKNFLADNGTLSDNEHTILISHTAGGILSSLTGLYPDRNGQAVSNSYGFFRSNGSVGFSSSFKYWTDITGRREPRDHSADAARGHQLQHGQRRLGPAQEHACAVGSRTRARGVTSATSRPRTPCSRTTTRSSSARARP